ncbi:hypothetical protein ABZ642_09405 [Streptomyces sp. NPDC007157]|uniref:hypothetical protein n=1 Tax=Streptomyces sp. NPDC007157 TaxID=3154681 RepID=UPI0033EB5BEC
MARNTVHVRLRRMATDGTLNPSSRRVDPAALGYGLAALMSLAVTTKAILAIDGVGPDQHRHLTG